MMNQIDFESIYEKYSPFLYGVAMQIISDKNKAEQILIGTFKKIAEQNITKDKHPNYCIILIRLTLKTAKDKFPLIKANNLNFHFFEKSPLVHQLVYSDTPIEDICIEKNIEHNNRFEIIRNEYIQLKNSDKERLLYQNAQIDQLRMVY